MNSQATLWEKVKNVSLGLLGLYIAYQILRKVFGGSWGGEAIIIALVMFNLGLTIAIMKNHGKELTLVGANQNYMRQDMREMKSELNKAREEQQVMKNNIQAICTKLDVLTKA